MKFKFFTYIVLQALLLVVSPCQSWAQCDPCDGDTCDSMGGRCIMAGPICATLPKSFLEPTDHSFDDFISPMINFVFFEDPRTLTEIRPIFMQHSLPDAVGSLGIPGGNVQLYAMQVRIALSDRLSIIAVKDGYVVADLDGPPLDSLLNDGWASVSAGLKYNLLRDPWKGSIISAGFTYDIPMGSRRTLQDIADGEFHLFLSAGQRFVDGKAHALSTFGWRLPVDPSAQTTSIHWSNHLDVKLSEKIYAVTEFAWWHWTDSADGGLGPVGFAGQDVLNVPATNVTGNNLLTQGVGLRMKPTENIELGAIYEFPLTEFKDIIDKRWTFDMIVRY